MHRTATVREPSLNLGIGERVVDLTVQSLDGDGILCSAAIGSQCPERTQRRGTKVLAANCW